MNLNINDHSFLSLVLVPFFNKLNFISKKELDYKDWRSILELKTNGWHLSDEWANLIRAVSSHMNNNRLSCNFLPAAAVYEQKNLDSTILPASEENLNYNLLLEKVKKLLSKPSNFEVYPDVKIFIKSEKKNFGKVEGM